ncbi:hypothetical protein PIROE2DRAFT_15193, partial [Piromyces sp. E2]
VIKAVVIKALAFTYNERVQLYTSLKNDFNTYSKAKSLNISLDLTILTPQNSTSTLNDYSSMIQTLLSKNSDKYDIYLFYSSYAEEYGKHLVNLNDYLEENIKNYDPHTISSVCLYEDKIVGLPITLDIDTLFSNQIYLTRYNKTPPKTWEELIETSKYIIERELANNNTDLIAYNGLVNDSEEGNVAIYEFIHSFRNEQDSPHPSLNNVIFKKDDGYLLEKVFTGTALFLKFWYLEYSPLYTLTPLPGAKEGVSSSIAGGYSIGICKYIDEDRKLAAIEIVKFFTSKDTLKKYMIQEHIFTPITSLYDDKDVCAVINCNFVKEILPFSFVSFDTEIYPIDEYNEKFRNEIYGFIYGNKTVEEVVDKAINLSKYTVFSINPEDNFVGLAFFIIFILTTIIMVTSLVFLHIKKLNRYFEFLSNDSWMIFMIGIFMMSCSILTLYGKMTPFKCHLKIILLTLGFNICMYPIICQLIINFSVNSKVSLWLTIHKYYFIFGMLAFNILIESLIFIQPYEIQNIINENDKNFQKCKMFGNFGKFALNLIFVYEAIIMLITATLIFLEWNMKEQQIDNKLVISSVFVEIISLVIFIIINNITIDHHVGYNAIVACNIIFTSLSNYILNFGVRTIIGYMVKEEGILNKSFGVRNSRHDSENKQSGSKTSNSISEGKNSSSDTRKSNITGKLLDFHNRQTKYQNQ